MALRDLRRLADVAEAIRTDLIEVGQPDIIVTCLVRDKGDLSSVWRPGR